MTCLDQPLIMFNQNLIILLQWIIKMAAEKRQYEGLRIQLVRIILIIFDDRIVMKIFLRQTNGNGYSIQVNPQSPIGDIVRWINKQQSSKISTYTLYFKGSVIKQLQKTFQSYNIKNNDIIHLIKPNQITQKQPHINLNVFYNNETYSLRINNKESVSKLKQQVYEITNVHSKDQYLVLNGKKLQDSLSLIQQNVHNNALISLVAVKRKEPNQSNEAKFPSHQNELLDSVSSLKLDRKVSLFNKNRRNSLFRSDSFGNKGHQEYLSTQVEIKFREKSIYLTDSISSEIDFRKVFSYIPSTDQIIEINSTQKAKLFKTNCQTDSLHAKLSCMRSQLKVDEKSGQSSSQISLYQKLKIDSSSLSQSLQFIEVPQLARIKLF